MHYHDNSDSNVIISNDVNVVITTNEKRMMMPWDDLNRLKQAILKPNGDPVVIDEDRFQCDKAQLNIMPVFELVTKASDGLTNRIRIPW